MPESEKPLPVKPGFKTTEFYLTLLAVILGGLASSGLLADGSKEEKIVGLVVVVLAQFGYASSRAKAKAGGGVL